MIRKIIFPIGSKNIFIAVPSSMFPENTGSGVFFASSSCFVLTVYWFSNTPGSKRFFDSSQKLCNKKH